MSGSQAEFDAAASYLSTSPALSKVSSGTKLELYALFKAATVAMRPQSKRPSIFDMTGRAKWDAWDELGRSIPDATPDDFRARYVAKARELGWDGTTQAQAAGIKLGAGSDDDPIDWDSDDHPRKAGSTGIANSVSTMSAVAGPADTDTLHGSVLSGDIDRLKTLLQSQSAHINALDEFGFTPLHLAADRGHERIVKLLLDNGADPNIQDPDGETALSLAQVSDHSAIIHLLQEKTWSETRENAT